MQVRALLIPLFGRVATAAPDVRTARSGENVVPVTDVRRVDRRTTEQGDEGSRQMPTWLILIIIGVVLLILGVAVEAAKFLLWIGIAVLVVSLILGLVRRGGSRV